MLVVVFGVLDYFTEAHSLTTAWAWHASVVGVTLAMVGLALDVGVYKWRRRYS
jgi:hypothetical protein